MSLNENDTTKLTSAQHDAASASNVDISGLSFKQGSLELESIVRKLEDNQLELEESLILYERGVRLLRQLQLQLDDAQQRVSVLMGELEPSSNDDVDMTLS